MQIQVHHLIRLSAHYRSWYYSFSNKNVDFQKRKPISCVRVCVMSLVFIPCCFFLTHSPLFSFTCSFPLSVCIHGRDLPVPAAPERHTWQSSAHHLLPHYPDLPRVISSVVSGVIGPWTFFMSLLTLLSAWLMCSYLWHLSAPLPSPGHLCYLHLPGNSARPLNPGCHLS